MLWKTWTFIVCVLMVLVSYRVYLVLHREIPAELEHPNTIRLFDEAGRWADKIYWVCHQLGIEPATWPAKLVINYGAKLLFNGFGSTLTNITVQYTTVDGVPVTIFQPDTLPVDKVIYPTMVYLHGGGWTWFSVDVYAGYLTHIAKRTNMQIVAVDYRKAPSFPFPAAYEDCLAATKGLLKRWKKFKIHCKKFIIAGDGSGGNLAAAVSHTLKDQIFMQVLINPALQMFDFKTPSYRDIRDTIRGVSSPYRTVYHWLSYAGVSTDYLQMALQNNHISTSLLKSALGSYVDTEKYLPDYHRVTKRKTQPRPDNGNFIVTSAFQTVAGNAQIAPLMAFNVDGVPNVYLVTSQYDVYRDEGIMYTHRLFDAGVKTKLEHYKEAFHGFFMFCGYGPIKFKVSEQAIDDLIEFLDYHLNQ